MNTMDRIADYEKKIAEVYEKNELANAWKKWADKDMELRFKHYTPEELEQLVRKQYGDEYIRASKVEQEKMRILAEDYEKNRLIEPEHQHWHQMIEKYPAGTIESVEFYNMIHLDSAIASYKRTKNAYEKSNIFARMINKIKGNVPSFKGALEKQGFQIETINGINFIMDEHRNIVDNLVGVEEMKGRSR